MSPTPVEILVASLKEARDLHALSIARMEQCRRQMASLDKEISAASSNMTALEKAITALGGVVPAEDDGLRAFAEARIRPFLIPNETHGAVIQGTQINWNVPPQIALYDGQIGTASGCKL